MSLEDAPPSSLLRDEANRTSLPPESVAAQSGWVRAVARNLVRDPWGAEDVAQEALLAALASPPREVPDDSHLRAWLGRVAYNLSRLDLRAGGRRRARERDVARREALPSTIEELEAVAARGELSRALRALDEPSRLVLQLRYFDGLSTAEIARRLEVSELAVRKRLWRARQKLRASLEPRRSGFQAWIALGSWRAFARLEVAGLAAAGTAALLALDFESERRGEESATDRLLSPLALLAEESGGGTPGEGANSTLPGAPTSEGRRRQPRSPTPPPVAPESEPRDESRPGLASARHAGLVLDLDGTPHGGLRIVASTAPTELLASTDALGGFTFEARGELELCAQGEGLVTVVPGWSTPHAEALVLVAPGAPFTASVQSADGTPLAAARVELLAGETAFVRIERSVTLASAVLSARATGDDGAVSFDELARARGLVLRVSCPGFAPLERPTLALGESAEFVLERAQEGPGIAGTVALPGGLPAVGARVRLALAETVTDAHGAFWLPLRGVGPDARLEARGHGFAPVYQRDLLKRFERGDLQDGVAMVLDRPLDPVVGDLDGPVDSFAGWRVFAFPQEAEGPYEARCDEEGRFEFELPRGSAELYAVAPDRLESHAGFVRDTRGGVVELEVLPRTTVQERVALRTDDGRSLPAAQVGLQLALSAEHQVRWGAVSSDAAGNLSYPRALEADVRLSVRHVELGPEPVQAPAAAELALVRARGVRIVGASSAATRARVLDAAGNVLAATGPLGAAEEFALEDGQSAMTFVPPAARWVELLVEGSAQRLALEAGPGERATLVP